MPDFIQLNCYFERPSSFQYTISTLNIMKLVFLYDYEVDSHALFKTDDNLTTELTLFNKVYYFLDFLKLQMLPFIYWKTLTVRGRPTSHARHCDGTEISKPNDTNIWSRILLNIVWYAILRFLSFENIGKDTVFFATSAEMVSLV